MSSAALGEDKGQEAEGREGTVVMRPPHHAARAGPGPVTSRMTLGQVWH